MGLGPLFTRDSCADITTVLILVTPASIRVVRRNSETADVGFLCVDWKSMPNIKKRGIV